MKTNLLPLPRSLEEREGAFRLAPAAAIGYELSEEDGEAVWNAFCEIAQRREQIDARELDAIVAAAAMQVPPTYILKSYVITSGNLTKAMATVVLSSMGRMCLGVMLETLLRPPVEWNPMSAS